MQGRSTRGTRRARDSAPGGTSGDKSADQRRGARARSVRFAVTFGVLAALFLGAYAFPYGEAGVSEGWFSAYLAATTRVAGALLGLIDASVRVEGTLITGQFALRVVKACSALETQLLFIAAIIAYPAARGRVGRKVVAAAAGLAVLTVANLVRICSLYVIGARAPSAFDLAHVELWPLLLVALAAAQFLATARWVDRPAEPA